MTKPLTTWQDVSAAKIAARDALLPKEWLLPKPPGDDVKNVMDIPRTCGILSDKEIEITETPALDLIAKLKAKELTSVEVTTAFCKRATIACQLTNCLSEVFFDQALKDAAKIDADYAATGTPAGALHGLPVSLKDNIDIKGLDTPIGFTNSANKPAADDAQIAKILRNAGAVLYCKTTVPTGMLMTETYSNLMGYTPNPYQRECSAGGSSGGEGVLVAMRGSPLGNGTDIGGSVRIPAALNGIFGLKPAAGRFPLRGMRAGLPGQEAVRSVIGPMGNDLDSIELWCKVVLESQPWEHDPMVYNLPWREVKLPEKLCFGIYLDDGACKPTPAVQRALAETRAALEAAGHKVVDYTPYNPLEAGALLMGLLGGDGGFKLVEQLTGPTPELTEPWPVGMKVFETIHEKIKSQPPTVGSLWETQSKRQAYLAKLLDAWMATSEITGTGRPIDGLISPVIPVPTAPRYKQEHVLYTALWNVADFTSIAFPAGVTKATDTKTGNEELRNDVERKVWDNYDAEQLAGCPIGLQIILPRHQEEKAIKLARVTHEALQKQRK